MTTPTERTQAYTKPTLTKKNSLQLTRQEHQLIRRLRQLREVGNDRAEVELATDGPKVKEGAAG